MFPTTGVSADSDVKYIEMKHKIVNIANQRISLVTPTPMDIDAVDQQGGDERSNIWNYEPPGTSWEEQREEQARGQGHLKGSGLGRGRGRRCAGAWGAAPSPPPTWAG